MLAVVIAATAPRITAHEVPNEVTVNGFVHPEGKTLRLLIRAPLKSMRDIDIPTVAGGFLDFSKMEAAERHAAQVWIRDFVELWENGKPLAVAGDRRDPHLAPVGSFVRELRRGARQHHDGTTDSIRAPRSTGTRACST